MAANMDDPSPPRDGAASHDGGLHHQLEDGALRREMGLPPKAEPIESAPLSYREPLVFHGKGAEYFRIWIVNICLTLLTLGVYSAWAKVRKATWFAQNTSLAGDRFNYHGDPLRVLLGRVVAIALVVAWSLAFSFSAVAGLIIFSLFCLIGPLLFASAQRFRLVNSSWRGLRFGFDAPRSKLYAVCVPLLVLWTLASVLQSLKVNPVVVGLASAAAMFGFPWAHAKLKQMQHAHAHFGEKQFEFVPATAGFYGVYLKAVFVAMAGFLVVVPIMMILVKLLEGGLSPVLAGVLGGSMALVGFLVAWPYFAARMQQLVWKQTRLGAIRFEGRMKFWPLLRLVVVQTVLTILTLGLYWPFAAVALARYRVQSVTVEAPAPFADVAASIESKPQSRAAGDAAADFFGLDLGW